MINDAPKVSPAPSNLQPNKHQKTKPGGSPRGAQHDRLPYLPLPGIPLLQLQPNPQPVQETLLPKRRPIRVCSPAEGEASVSFGHCFLANQRRHGLEKTPPASRGEWWAALHLAAVSHSEERRLPPPIGVHMGGAPANRARRAGRRAQPGGRSSVRAAVLEAGSVPGLRRPLSRRDPGRHGDKGESREGTVASLHVGDPV